MRVPGAVSECNGTVQCLGWHCDCNATVPQWYCICHCGTVADAVPQRSAQILLSSSCSLEELLQGILSLFRSARAKVQQQG